MPNSPALESVEVGQSLLTRPIGPHSLPSLASEWRGYTFTVWGSTYHEGADHLSEAGWLDEMDRDLEGAQEDPELGDGLYHGPSRGHTDEEHARLIGMPRGYGYGASMGAWVLDYVSAWAGDRGFVRHSAVQYRFPAFDGDLTLLDAEVTDARYDKMLGRRARDLGGDHDQPGRVGDGEGAGGGRAARVGRRRHCGSGRRTPLCASSSGDHPLRPRPGIGALTMGGLLAEVAARHTGREALCFHDRVPRAGSRRRSGEVVRWSYAELETRARRFAKALAAAGVGKGTRVALLMGNRPEWVEAAFGVALAGGVLVPVNTLFEPPEIEHVLRHSDSAVLVYQERLANHRYHEQVRSMVADLPYLTTLACLEHGLLRRLPRRRRRRGRRRRRSDAPPRSRRTTTRSSSTPRDRRASPKACSTRIGPPRSRAGASPGTCASIPASGCGAPSRSSGRRATAW